ncbi:protein kinase DC1 [Elysia marginata]|uniref:non-specific serine/threonine protein kinase n=1 Tax=Elysia marginata TaxID=1093978 RepID=A0AAV4HZ83_9GAST|nr:protein kinase DC1 [Elysia marginata]
MGTKTLSPLLSDAIRRRVEIPQRPSKRSQPSTNRSRKTKLCQEPSTQQYDDSTLVQCYTAVKCQDYLAYSMPFYDHGDLIQLENENGKPFDTKIITNSILHVAIAMEYLHKHYLAHNDIKLENEFVENWGYVHLGDFGFVRQITAETRTFRARDLGAVGGLHQHFLAHNDIKPDNVFVDKWGYAHLGDFGFVRQMTAETRTVRARDLGGTSTTHATE